jgi:hypothetical protein
MADTLGSLVDKLSITNIKLWMVQDEVNHAAEAGDGVDADIIKKLVTLNRLRTRLMTEIDKAGGGEVEERIKL